MAVPPVAPEVVWIQVRKSEKTRAVSTDIHLNQLVCLKRLVTWVPALDHCEGRVPLQVLDRNHTPVEQQQHNLLGYLQHRLNQRLLLPRKCDVHAIVPLAFDAAVDAHCHHYYLECMRV
jgi:hypothetical protein